MTDFWSRELQAGRCPEAGDSQHGWDYEQPPEWMDTDQWTHAEWDDWYDTAARRCWRCGETDEP